MTTVFVLNAGSSSIKYTVLDVADGNEHAVLADGIVERIGVPGGVPDHATALASVLAQLGDRAIDAVGHRVVHGGERFTDATVIDDDVEAAIEQLIELAPLHNPAGLAGIRAARAALPDVPHVAVFDTAFHATIPIEAATYAIDADLAARHGIRRYGFHGTSYQYVSRVAAETLGREPGDLRMIVLHLGNGASAAAIRGGRSVDTSMGLTPLEGLVMGTRSGDLDPAIPFHLNRVAGLTIDELDDLLNRRSGMLGLSGHADMREVIDAADGGDEPAALALEVYLHRIRHYIGAYAAVLGGLDALVFTAGVGENSDVVRAGAVRGLEFLGIALDLAANAVRGDTARVISPAGSRVAVLVVPTDEELEIARQTVGRVSAEPGRAGAGPG
jgi:acetate kinase